jgi:acyl carrier protein
VKTKNLEEISGVLMRETQAILSLGPTEVTPEMPLASLGFDSVTFQELLVAIERNFGVKYLDGLEPEDMLTLHSMGRWIGKVS